MTRMLRIEKKTFKRAGKTIHRKSYLTPDKGKPGRTPKSERWARFETKTGWEKDMPIKERRGLVLNAHGGDYLSSARAMQQLANVTTDKETKTRAAADAKYFYAQHRKEGVS